MMMLRVAVLFLAVVFAAATVNVTREELEDGFYGIDEQPEPTDAAAPAEPVDQPEVDGGRGGRGRHHQRGRGHHHRGHHGHHGMRGGNWTDEQKLTYLCSKLQQESTTSSSGRGSSRGGNHGNRIHWKLRTMNETTRQTFMNVWNQRKQELTGCCNQATPDAKMQCVNIAKAARYERVCNREEPLCHWSTLRSSRPSSSSSSNTNAASSEESSQQITARCCTRQGAERVACFVEAKNSYRQRYQHQSRSHGSRGGPGRSN